MLPSRCLWYSIRVCARKVVVRTKFSSSVYWRHCHSRFCCCAVREVLVLDLFYFIFLRFSVCFGPCFHFFRLLLPWFTYAKTEKRHFSSQVSDPIFMTGFHNIQTSICSSYNCGSYFFRNIIRLIHSLSFSGREGVLTIFSHIWCVVAVPLSKNGGKWRFEGLMVCRVHNALLHFFKTARFSLCKW